MSILRRGSSALLTWGASYLNLRMHGIDAALRTTAGPREATFESVGSNVKVDSGSRFMGHIRLGDSVHVGEDCRINGTISIGRGTNLVENNWIAGKVTIGQYCAVAPYATVRAQNHETQQPAIQDKFYRRVLNSELGKQSKGPVRIGHDVWIGTHAIILSGVTVGNGAVIGAGAVVTDDVDSYEIVAGTPAEHKGWRFDEDARETLRSKGWWNWSEEEMRENRDFFETPL